MTDKAKALYSRVILVERKPSGLKKDKEGSRKLQLAY